ncbi:MAG: lmo0937 family membrane protein [Candidatus Acidiferrales bacterium]
MLGIIAVVLIVLWLLGFFAFHVTSAFVHVALVVGLIFLVLHLLRGSTSHA